MPSAAPLTAPQIPHNPPNLADKLPTLGTPRRASGHRTSSTPNNPPPPTPALAAPIFSSTPTSPQLRQHRWRRPTKSIISSHDLELFAHSPTHDLIVAFVFTLSDAVRDRRIGDVEKLPAALEEHGVIQTLMGILDEAGECVKQHPAVEAGGSRFGNVGFRNFSRAVEEKLREWHGRLGLCETGGEEQAEKIVGSNAQADNVEDGDNDLNKDVEAWQECSEYLRQSFGNQERIDYGSGHELNFLLWLLCLRQLGIIPTSSMQAGTSQSSTDRDVFAALALIVFPRYLRLMRTIQSTYYLEPAGSHGVWGLDDYQFLPFLFGASQLCPPARAETDSKKSHPLTPKSIHNQEFVEAFRADYLYFDQVAWVNSTKIGVEGIRWHSPMLDDISAAKNWEKVEGGMRKMFLAEVLGKLPVVQHFLFGSIIQAADGMGEEGKNREVVDDEHGHAHDGKGWNDCCGIQVPSAVGAVQEARKTDQAQQRLRRLPFD